MQKLTINSKAWWSRVAKFVNKDYLLPYQKDYIRLCDNNRCVIVMKGRQSGFTLVEALWQVRQRLRKNTNCYYVSRTERTAAQFSRYVKLWASFLNIAIQEKVINLAASTQSIITFPKGNFIQVMPSGPDVVRGLPGDLVMDEAAVIEHAQEFFDASFPTITAGHSFHIISTIGPPGCFHSQEWDKAVAGNSVFVPFKVTMDDAVQQGLANIQGGDHQKLPPGPERNKAFIRFIKKGMSQEAYDSEFNCIQRGLGGLITTEEYDKQAVCDISDDIWELDKKRKSEKNPLGALYACIDPAFNHDLAAIWILEKRFDPTPNLAPEYTDVYVTVCVQTWEKIAPRALHQIVKQYLSHPNMVKCLIDAGGVGYQLAHDLTQDFGGMVEPLVVTNAVKQEAYERVKYFLQTDRLGLPKDRPDIKKEFLSITRKLTPTGHVTYEGRIGSNHGDRFCACAYALHSDQHNRVNITITSRT